MTVTSSGRGHGPAHHTTEPDTADAPSIVTDAAQISAAHREPTGRFPQSIGTDSQRTGLAGGAFLGAIVGAVVLVPFGFIDWGASVDTWVRFATAAVIGAIAGAAAGAVYWGGRLPELTGDSPGTDRSEGDAPGRARGSEGARPASHPNGPGVGQRGERA